MSNKIGSNRFIVVSIEKRIAAERLIRRKAKENENMINMNDCKICGNLVRDPEIKSTSSRSELPPQNDDLPF